MCLLWRFYNSEYLFFWLRCFLFSRCRIWFKIPQRDVSAISLCVHWKYVSPATPVTILRKGGESLEHPIPGRRLPGCVPKYIESIPSQTQAALLGFLLLRKDETPFDTFCFCCLLWGNVFHTNLAHGWNDVGSQKHGVKQHHWLFPKFFFFFLRKSWKVRRVENIDNCCRTCGKKGDILWKGTFSIFKIYASLWILCEGAARNKPDLVAFHYQQRKRTCVCFSSHPKVWKF